jgi:hypothetical protein
VKSEKSIPTPPSSPIR